MDRKLNKLRWFSIMCPDQFGKQIQSMNLSPKRSATFDSNTKSIKIVCSYVRFKTKKSSSFS